MNHSRSLLLAAFLSVILFARAGEPEPKPFAWPEVWGELGLQGYATGDRVAPNGFEFEPIFRQDLTLNLGLLPRRKLYVFLETEFWNQRASANSGLTNKNQGSFDFSKREFDLRAGFAWNFFDRFELRASSDALNSLNRGVSKTYPEGARDGAELETRYYFGSANSYDVGRLSFLGVGYTPEHDFIGGDGSTFRGGFFAQAYATYGIPALRSYLFGQVKLTQERNDDLRLVTFDAGLATRPFSRVQNLEVRVGNEFTADLQDDTTRDLVYGAIRAYFGPSDGVGKELTGQIRADRSWPEVWGDFGVSIYAHGARMAPNGVPFDPLFKSDFTLNLGLVSQKKLYLLLENEYWLQRFTSAGDAKANPSSHEISQREFDLNVGVAYNIWNRFEFRALAYALNNLNRGGAEAKQVSQTLPSGYQDGTQVELRYYLSSDNIYDLPRQNFFSVGYFPAQTMIGGDGVGFHPGFFARAYGSYGLPQLRSFLFADARFVAEKPATARLVTFDAGLGVRPFSRFDNLEFRFGNELTADVEVNTTRNLSYGAIRLNFSNR